VQSNALAEKTYLPVTQEIYYSSEIAPALRDPNSTKGRAFYGTRCASSKHLDIYRRTQ